jgi:hypothetical protein
MYAAVIHGVVCDPAVSAFYYFHLVDDPDLDRFQSGLLRLDWTKRPAYLAVKEALAASRGECSRAPEPWRHTQTVVGADVTFGDDGTLTLEAAEEAIARAGNFPTTATEAEITKALSRGDVRPRLVRAYRPATIDVGAAPPTKGTYVNAVLLRAAMNPERSFLAVSDPLVVSSS